jgi:hypothetical protein
MKNTKLIQKSIYLDAEILEIIKRCAKLKNISIVVEIRQTLAKICNS